MTASSIRRPVAGEFIPKMHPLAQNEGDFSWDWYRHHQHDGQVRIEVQINYNYCIHTIWLGNLVGFNPTLDVPPCPICRYLPLEEIVAGLRLIEADLR